MALRLKPIDTSQIQTGSIRRRTYRLNVEQLGSMPQPSEPLQSFYRSLPKVGEAAGMLDAAELMAQTALTNKPMLWILDGTLMDAGLSPLLVYLMRRGLVHGVVMNGEAALRDYELAFHGMTAEDHAAGLADGLLGMTRETGEGINAIINEGVKRGFSIGECVGRGILERQPKHFTNSVLATGAARLTPATVHVCLGADGFHRYPGADGAMLGKGSMKDVQILTGFLTSLPPGGLIVSTHRDQMLNQVLVHAYALARNLHEELKGLHLIRLGEPEPSLLDLPALDRVHHVPGPLEIIIPLLLGALFSLVE